MLGLGVSRSTRRARASRALARAAAAALFVTLVAGPAEAQPSPDAPPSPSPAPGESQPQSAKDAEATSASISEEARQHFKAGVALLQDPEGEKVEEAYREFRAAYDLSGSPKILGNMGFCAMRLERDGEAIDAYSRYIREVKDIDPEERAQIIRDLQTLQVGVVRLTIEVNKPGVRLLDERTPVRGARVTNGYGPVNGKIEIGVRPGHHVITAKLAGHEDQTWELEAYAGSRDKHAFVLKEPPPPAPPPVAVDASSSKGGNVAPWIVIGTGGALLVAGTITGVIALGKTNDIEDRCPNDVCPRGFDLDSERSTAKTFVRVTDVLLLTGGVAVVGGAAWLLLSGGREGKRAAVVRTLENVRAACAADGCRAAYGVSF